MNWKASPPAIEIAAAWTAALSLGGAVGFAIARIAPLGAGLVEAGVAGVFVALIGGVTLGRIDRRRGVHPSFVAIEPPGDGALVESLPLDSQPDDDDALLLDDPLPPIDDHSRVVRLFAAQPGVAAAPVTIAAPGEMAARIEDFLGQARGDAGARTASRPATEDASAALHAALADIRRSLRHG